jgi:serine/threonine protein kinase
VLKLLDAFETDAHMLLVSELCPNGDLPALAARLAPGTHRLPRPAAQVVFSQLLAGVDFLHRRLGLRRVFLGMFIHEI